MTQIRGVTSESLEAKIRELLPSQAGFTEELSAQNLIVPVIDLTAAAEGTETPASLQQAWDFSTGHNTITTVGPTTLISTPGFWKVDLTCSLIVQSSSYFAKCQINDTSSTKVVWQVNTVAFASNDGLTQQQDTFVVYLRGGDTFEASCTAGGASLNIWYRQIADVNGTLVNPLGFTPQ